ncbi:MAG: molybdopterin-dependent oxidoreductase [Methylotetracoccus sp.]
MALGLSASGLRSVLAAGETDHITLPFANGERELASYPQKRPLIRLTGRPPQLETPFAVFDEGLLTPNDAFFVRYHLSGIPTRVDPATYRLRVGGLVERPLTLALDDVKRIGPAQDLVAVHQCSGNSRGFFDPRIHGGQLGHGAMGNARWTGAPLRAVLERAGIRRGAVQVTFDGLDKPVFPATPDFVKALPVAHAMDGEVLLAWAMNGADLPMLNGYPLRLVVPGYFGTYWVKHLSDIEVVDREYDGFFMGTAYRIPDNDCGCVELGGKPDRTRPIDRFVIRSFITSPAEGTRHPVGGSIPLRGIAFDGGHGIARVEYSTDGGAHWQAAALGTDLGRYSFRPWTATFQPDRAGPHDLRVRAIGVNGERQPDTALWNPSGYRYNAVMSVRIIAG